ncbi:MAG: hypothetical protein VB980_01400, partial [Opitutales bacterium]
NWFGFFHQVDENWAFHADFGWIYVDEVTENAFWFLHDLLGWMWTNGEVFPSVWSTDKNNWIRFHQAEESNLLQGNDNGRLFYFDYSSDQWDLARPSYEVTARISPSEGGSVSGTTFYAEGTTASLVAVAADGFEFIGWSGDADSSSPSLVLTVNSDLQVTANFIQFLKETVQPTAQESLENIFGK